MDAFVTRLRSLSKTCEFGDQTDEAIRDQAIDKCVSTELRRRLLRLYSVLARIQVLPSGA